MDMIAWVKSPHHKQLTTRQIAVLLLVEQGPLQVLEVAKRLNLSKPVVTRSINSLRGYVTRTRDIVDHRRVWISLTGKGVQLLDRMRDPLNSQ